jgi:hypothetical protein
VVAWIHSLRSEQLFIAAFTLGEIQSGVERIRVKNPIRAAEIEVGLDGAPDLFQILPMDVACFREWVRLTGDTRNRRDFTSFGVALVNPFEYR